MWKGYHFRCPGAHADNVMSFFYAALRAFLDAQGWELFDTYGGTKARMYLYGSNYFPNNSRVKVDGVWYTFKTTLTPAEGEVLAGANAAEGFDNLKLAVNRTDPDNNDGVKYKIAAAHPLWEATDNADGSQYFDARTLGVGSWNYPDNACENTNWFGWSGLQVWGTDQSTVWRSNGESGEEPYGYVALRASNYYTFGVSAYQYWNAGSHTGTRKAYEAYSSDIDGWDASYDVMIAGDKDIVYIHSKMAHTPSSSRLGMVFGHLPKRCFPGLIKTTDAIEDGDNVNIPVTDSSKVPGAGGYVQIVGLSEGCDRLRIVSVPDATHIIVANLPRDYASGATIGQPASVFFLSQYVTNWGDQYLRQTSYPTDAGLVVGTTSTYASFLNISGVSPFTGRGAMSPIFFMVNGHPVLGYIDQGVFFFSGPGHYDIIGMNDDDSLVAANILATSATGTSITDNTKDWEPDEFIGKYVVIVGGIGIGQIRKITNNDETTITIGYPWYINPDGTTTFRVYDTAYRYHSAFPFNTPSAHLVTHTEVPA